MIVVLAAMIECERLYTQVKSVGEPRLTVR
jgi:hypothetical protein